MSVISNIIHFIKNNIDRLYLLVGFIDIFVRFIRDRDSKKVKIEIAKERDNLHLRDKILHPLWTSLYNSHEYLKERQYAINPVNLQTFLDMSKNTIQSHDPVVRDFTSNNILKMLGYHKDSVGNLNKILKADVHNIGEWIKDDYRKALKQFYGIKEGQIFNVRFDHEYMEEKLYLYLEKYSSPNFRDFEPRKLIKGISRIETSGGIKKVIRTDLEKGDGVEAMRFLDEQRKQRNNDLWEKVKDAQIHKMVKEVLENLEDILKEINMQIQAINKSLGVTE